MIALRTADYSFRRDFSRALPSDNSASSPDLSEHRSACSRALPVRQTLTQRRFVDHRTNGNLASGADTSAWKLAVGGALLNKARMAAPAKRASTHRLAVTATLMNQSAE